MKEFIERITGIRLRYRLFLIYIIGGVLPMILICLYLVHGISGILIGQAEHREVTELEMIRSQAEETILTVSTVTKYFYFDSELESIAEKKYENYQDVVDDYRAYTGFRDYTEYQNNIIGWANLYIKNDSLVENARFIKVTEEMEGEEWYTAAGGRNGGAVWRSRPIPADGRNALTILRMLKTDKGRNVGILAVYIRPERFDMLLRERDCATLAVLNGDTLIADTVSEWKLEEIAAFLPGEKPGQFQDSIRMGGSRYLMTCETISLAESEDYLQIVSLRAYSDILREVNGQNRKSLLIFGVSVILSVSIILIFSRSYSNRVEHFRTQMHRAAEGNFELEDMGGKDEIASLYQYLGTMIGEIQRLLAEVYRERLHADRLTIQQKDAEFNMLASQINPHFLYNTLETIRMKARKSGQGDIEEIVKMLAKIMRSYIRVGSRETSLRTEIELVECYLKIQRHRFGDRIQYHIQVEPALEEYRILPLLIQPIVENSIIHGLESKEGSGNLWIRACGEHGRVKISIRDDGLGIPADRLEGIRQRLNRYDEKSRHIGVGNVHQRIQLKYGGDYGVEIDSAEGQYTEVKIFLPEKEAENGGESYVQSNDH